MPQIPNKEWLTTQDLAAMFNITVNAAGDWFRRGVIPKEHATQVPVEKIQLEWRADAEFILNEFVPPDPRGGRPKK